MEKDRDKITVDYLIERFRLEPLSIEGGFWRRVYTSPETIPSSALPDRYEGDNCPNPSCGDQGGCVIADYVPPLRQYEHEMNGPCAVTGGYVYRGCRMADLHGTYFYADYCSGRLWGLQYDGAEWQSALLTDTNYNISTFGEDEAGNLYLTDYFAGDIYMITE